MGYHKKTRKNPKGAGRPPGSKNKTSISYVAAKRGPGRPRKLSSVISRIRALDETEFRNLRGRPKGSTKSKHIDLKINGEHYTGTVKRS